MTTVTRLDTPRRPRLPSRRVALTAMLVLAVGWAFAWGAHSHSAPGATVDLSGVEPDRRFTIDASTGVLDLASIAVLPGEVVEFTLAGSAGSPHSFVITGADSAQMDTLTNAAGDTVVRLQVPEDGALSFMCTIPGHEGLHGNLVVTPEDAR